MSRFLFLKIVVQKNIDVESVWPDLKKFHHFFKNSKIFGSIFKVSLDLGKVFKSLWCNLYAGGQIFIVVNGKILKKQSGHVDVDKLSKGPRH